MTKEVLVYAYGKWHIAHQASNSVTAKLQWERRDGSYICDVDSNPPQHPLPPKPSK